MTDVERQLRNTTMLGQCHPIFAARVRAIIAELEASGYHPRIQQAWRSLDQQVQAQKTGHSSVVWSFHMATAEDGTPEALAVDLLEDTSPIVPPMPYEIRLAAIAARYVCRTGILWGLSPGPRERLSDAIADGRWDYKGSVGWDPTHVEIGDLTLLEAKNGKRPVAA